MAMQLGLKKRTRNSVNASKIIPFQFKKGHKPKHTVEVGTITEMKTTAGLKKFIKTKNGWELYHRVVWTMINGPIPKNHLIKFRDNNPLNCAIENLYLITKSELVRLNTNPKKISESLKRFHRIKELRTRYEF